MRAHRLELGHLVHRVNGHPSECSEGAVLRFRHQMQVVPVRWRSLETGNRLCSGVGMGEHRADSLQDRIEIAGHCGRPPVSAIDSGNETVDVYSDRAGICPKAFARAGQGIEGA